MLSSCFIVNKPRRDFFIEIMLLFLSIKGKMNFTQFGRFGKFGEQKYRKQFEKYFNFLNFNKNMAISHSSGKFAIAFDPSYISKSGNVTYGKDKFWSGIDGTAKFGLETGGIAAIDIDNKPAFHLEAIQTPKYEDIEKERITLIEWYANLIVVRKDNLETISTFLVADAYFSKMSRNFDKSYNVSFMNRNDRKTEHLLTQLANFGVISIKSEIFRICNRLYISEL